MSMAGWQIQGTAPQFKDLKIYQQQAGCSVISSAVFTTNSPQLPE